MTTCLLMFRLIDSVYFIIVFLLFRSNGGDQKVPIDVYYKLLTKTTQILREEYIQKMREAKVEYEKR